MDSLTTFLCTEFVKCGCEMNAKILSEFHLKISQTFNFDSYGSKMWPQKINKLNQLRKICHFSITNSKNVTRYLYYQEISFINKCENPSDLIC